MPEMVRDLRPMDPMTSAQKIYLSSLTRTNMPSHRWSLVEGPDFHARHAGLVAAARSLRPRPLETTAKRHLSCGIHEWLLKGAS